MIRTFSFWTVQFSVSLSSVCQGKKIPSRTSKRIIVRLLHDGFCAYHRISFAVSIMFFAKKSWFRPQSTLHFVIPYLVKKASTSSSAILRHIAKELKMNRREMLLENFKFIFSFLVRTCSPPELEKALGYVQVRINFIFTVSYSERKTYSTTFAYYADPVLKIWEIKW